ncbi:GIY-YIG nuclease family protein [Brevundimonas sp. S30B]|uniref:GIY-YIG nuclease family protein n=1 Tax=unclassified Brevundimonas TaxID=2622653 RepID=UPI0010724124|nr:MULTISPECIES: GIY-YIG nuclease family protein [unclassified Brevundimonas]QBX38487.1 GIY-YIG nuclease family protein [Brevundimonas sp. MF30-B]TFW02270.1 GIY-YIG nuclease family protein [Brevundimonas sp. S30B]
MARLTDDSFIAAYIVASGRNGTLYVGVSSDLPARVVQHKQKTFKGFTSAYGCSRLVWYERHAHMVEAIRRERAIKRWLRDWKLKLIEDLNPEWRDLSEGWYD